MDDFVHHELILEVTRSVASVFRAVCVSWCLCKSFLVFVHQQVGRHDCLITIDCDADSRDVTDDVAEYLSSVADVINYFEQCGKLRAVWNFFS